MTVRPTSVRAAAATYVQLPRPLFSRLPFDYRRIPEKARSGLLRLAATRAAPAFPRWPIETTIDATPSGIDYAGKRFALLLTHDIDSRAELDLIEPIRARERELGIRSAFGFIPEMTWPTDRLVDTLLGEGCQVYWHDLAHDAQLPWTTAQEVRQRIAAIDAASTWAPRITTFRSGQLLMSPSLLSVLGERFAIDLSIPDSERGGPYGTVAGCGSVVPFRIGRLLELPMTMPQDYYLARVFGLNPRSIYDVWSVKLDHIARVGGVAVLNSHPVWINPVDRHAAGMWAMYQRFLEVAVARDDVLVSTPDEVSRAISASLDGSA